MKKKEKAHDKDIRNDFTISYVRDLSQISRTKDENNDKEGEILGFKHLRSGLNC